MTPEQAAEAARGELGVGLDSPVPDLLRILEDAAGLRVFVLPLSEGVDGAYQLQGGTPFVLVNQQQGAVRKRFTLAHEYGHHYLGHGSRIDQQISLGDTRTKEIEANQFAASFLVPRRAIDGWMAIQDQGSKIDLETVVRMAFFFNVSSWVTLYRLQDAGRVGPAAKKRLAQALRDEEHYEVAAKLGLQRAEDSILGAHERGGYVPAEMQRKVADLVNRNLLPREAAKARLHLDDVQAEARLNELLAPQGAEPDDEI